MRYIAKKNNKAIRAIARMISGRSARRAVCAALIAGGGVLALSAKGDKSAYIDWGVKGSDFGAALQQWEKGRKWSEDDNFFISRVKPRRRFINRDTQINPSLDDTNDKNLIFWVPINDQDWNALPDGAFDSEVFPMWAYVTHYGNWSAPLIRIPAPFLDVAHRNGVPVSAVASIPYGDITEAWETGLNALVDAGADKLAEYLLYYGVDGIGYNSEFQGKPSLVKKLVQLHAETLAKMQEAGNPTGEFIWYDGTNINGRITFDKGLGSHNRDIFGADGVPGASLFLNYNWNNTSLLTRSVAEAESIGRSPLDLYCGINMQGREPHNTNPEIWTLLSKHPLSIGLWGAHSQNMFFESRAEAGSTPEQRQRTYLERVRRWFCGGDGNPLTAADINNSLIFSAEGDNFFGMAKMMSARSALKWDLAEEPFITDFNLGNGRFFNLEGVRQNDSEWYNIGVQDYMPTWMWWFSDTFLGRDPETVPAAGLKAEFTWDDAWTGGSSLRVHGTSDTEYLHLFKTEFALHAGDRIRVRHKRLAGEGEIALVLSLKGAEDTPVGTGLTLAESSAGAWSESVFTVGQDLIVPDGAEAAMVALRFDGASGLDIRLGELAILRDVAFPDALPVPVIEKSQLLHADKDGAEAKLIFNLPGAGDAKRYNSDFGVSQFRLYAQQEGAAPVLMGTTTSWAALIFGAPFTPGADARVRFGVSSVSLDRETESGIAWGDYASAAPLYIVDEGVSVDKPVLVPGLPFTVSFDDPAHPAADWYILDSSSNRIAESKGRRSIAMPEGLGAPGSYDVSIVSEGQEHLLRSFLQVSEREQGYAPVILDYQTKEEDGSLRVDYQADFGEGTVSRALEIGETGAGFLYSDAGLKKGDSFSVSFWFRADGFPDEASHFFNMRDKSARWAINHWGWCWHTLGAGGTGGEFSVRTDSGATAAYSVEGMQLYPGAWHHFAYVFDFTGDGKLKPALYLDGRQVTLTPTGEIPPASDPVRGQWKEWGAQTAVAVGGYLHKCGSVSGSLDNLAVWNKPLTADEIPLSMGDFDPENLPEGLVGAFGFEEAPGDDNRFASVGERRFGAGSIGYKDTEVEGQGTLQWRAPEYRAGAPALSGDAYAVESEVEWSAPGVEAAETRRDADGGSALFRLPQDDAERAVRLELRNEYGSDWREIPLVPGLSALPEIGAVLESLTVSPSLFDSHLTATAPEAGEYTLSLFDMEGRRLLSNRFSVESGAAMRIYPEVPSGPYLLLLEKDGRAVGSARVVRK